MKKKTNIIIILAILLCASSVFFSYAYFIRVTTSTNIITFGSLKLKLINNSIVDGKEVALEDGNIIDVTNNSEVSRIVRVENVGNHPMFVRIYLDVFFENKKIDEELISNYMTFDFDSNWTYKDGYYYYNDVLDGKESTTNLFTNINFNINKILQDNYAGQVDIKTHVEAVQSENNAKNVLEVEGWPDKN